MTPTVPVRARATRALPTRAPLRRPPRVELLRLSHLVGVGSVSVAAGDLEQRRQLLQLRMSEEDAELLADHALADVVVPVAVGAERRLRVVHVQRAQPVEPDLAIQIAEQGVQRLAVGDVVARHPQVARVEADAESWMAVEAVEQRRQLLERASDRAA